MQLSGVNSIISFEVENKKAKEIWMKFLDTLLDDSLEDHFYKVAHPCSCGPEYILVIPDKHKDRFNAFMKVWAFAVLKSADILDRSMMHEDHLDLL